MNKSNNTPENTEINTEINDDKTIKSRETKEINKAVNETNETDDEKNRSTATRQVDTANGVIDPRHASPKEDLSTDNNLELHSMTRKERRAAKRENFNKNTEGMSFKEKAGYFFYCYKWPIISVIVAIAVICVVVIEVYSNSRPIALAYGIVNCQDTETLDISIIEEDYMEYYGFGNGYQIIGIYNLDYDLETYEDNYDISAPEYSSFPTLCYEGYYDIIISDKKGLDYVANTAMIHPLEDSLTTDLYNIFKEEYSDLIVYSENNDGESCEYALDISDTEFVKELCLDYDDVYLCFVGVSDQNFTNARRICKFIFDLDIDA